MSDFFMLDRSGIQEALEKAKQSNSLADVDPILYQVIQSQEVLEQSRKSHDVEALWVKKGGKTAGANGAGSFGGFYSLKVKPEVKVFFKQDPKVEKKHRRICCKQVHAFFS